MASGIVIVDKPEGWTSQDVAAKLRGVFRERRVGHGGTLDPMATGVLPVFVGRATRAAEYFESAEKEYLAGLRLGAVTNTQDISGEILETRSVEADRAGVEAALSRFTGPQEQLPPMYSAVKINGRKLYELARRGREVERRPRKIEIFSLKLEAGEDTDYLLRVRCSKGTYIRTLCHDLGQALGCGGCMSSLRRTRAGRFTLEDAVPLRELIAADAPEAFLRPADVLFEDLPAITLTVNQEKPCKNGAPFTLRGARPGRCRVYSSSGEFWLLGRVENGKLYTEKSFFEVQELKKTCRNV